MAYVHRINTLIDNHTAGLENKSDYQIEWELLKVKIRDFTRSYSKQKSIHNKNALLKLYNELNDSDSALAANPARVAAQSKRDQIKIKIELLEQQKSRAAQVRARVKWVEEGEKNTKYFLNLEKSRANSKIMEKVTDENGHTITKQANIINVQKDFFFNLYKKKINSDEMEEKIDTFMRNTVTPTISVPQKDKCEGVVVGTELFVH